MKRLIRKALGYIEENGKRILVNVYGDPMYDQFGRKIEVDIPFDFVDSPYDDIDERFKRFEEEGSKIEEKVNVLSEEKAVEKKMVTKEMLIEKAKEISKTGWEVAYSKYTIKILHKVLMNALYMGNTYIDQEDGKYKDIFYEILNYIENSFEKIYYSVALYFAGKHYMREYINSGDYVEQNAKSIILSILNIINKKAYLLLLKDSENPDYIRQKVKTNIKNHIEAYIDKRKKDL